MFTGGFRLGVSRLQVTQVISNLNIVDKELIASRLIVFFKQNYANISCQVSFRTVTGRPEKLQTGHSAAISTILSLTKPFGSNER